MNDTQRLHDLLERFDTAMLISYSGGERVHARPMQIARLEEDCRVWFFTARDTAKAHEIAEDRRVLLVLQAERSVYLSIEGAARLVDERSVIAELWREPFKIWFPQGIEDPQLVAIEVAPQRAEFWDHSGVQKAAYLWEAAKAYLKGDVPSIREGEQHGVVVP